MKSPKSCFISAPFSADTSNIRSLLLARAIKPLALSDLPTERFHIDQVSQAIDHADMVFAVLDTQSSNLNTLFELGYAYAQKKRIFILAPPKFEYLPFDMSHFVVIRATPDNVEAIDFALSQALAAPSNRKRRPLKGVEKSKPIGSVSDKLLRELENMGQNVTEHELLNLVATALNASGISVLKESRSQDPGFDFAIWSDELGPWVGNPFLIEIKRSLNGPQDLQRLRNRFAHRGELVPGWLMVLYWEASPRFLDSRNMSPILPLQIRRLISELKTKSFRDIVLELRNEMVHVAGL
jgi:hypothetical protein